MVKYRPMGRYVVSECLNCTNAFVKKQVNQRTCSRKCSSRIGNYREKSILARKAYDEANRENKNVRQVTKHFKTRQEVISRLGNVCECCGESNFFFLTIDHKNNDGSLDRKRGLRAGALLRHILGLEDPKSRFQVLCYNCNCAKGAWGTCPHQNR